MLDSNQATMIPRDLIVRYARWQRIETPHSTRWRRGVLVVEGVISGRKSGDFGRRRYV